jgi:PHD/YefM family antitoxin component YafN of YafNO toxin-antitoxin module
MLVTATEAKNRLGRIFNLAKKEPVYVQKYGKVDTVIISADQFETLRATLNSVITKKKQADFEKRYGHWIKEMNQDFGSIGHWSEELKVW